jgi:hypothetical protein
LIPGFNTDIEHDGITYHVQTEDKGLDSPLILSLVYNGGAILASKRTRYDDLLRAGFDEATLTARLQKQHKLICAAIRNGRIEDLKRMNESANERVPSSIPPQSAAAHEFPGASRVVEEAAANPLLNTGSTAYSLNANVADFARYATTAGAPQLVLLDDPPIIAGERSLLKLRLTRARNNQDVPLAGVRVTVVGLGTAFSRIEFSNETDAAGIVTFDLIIPAYKKGRGVLVFSAICDEQEIVLRRIMQPA